MNNMLGMKYGLRLSPNKIFMQLLLESRALEKELKECKGWKIRIRAQNSLFGV